MVFYSVAEQENRFRHPVFFLHTRRIFCGKAPDRPHFQDWMQRYPPCSQGRRIWVLYLSDRIFPEFLGSLCPEGHIRNSGEEGRHFPAWKGNYIRFRCPVSGVLPSDNWRSLWQKMCCPYYWMWSSQHAPADRSCGSNFALRYPRRAWSYKYPGQWHRFHRPYEAVNVWQENHPVE